MLMEKQRIHYSVLLHVAEMDEIFDQMDLNHDGRISVHELKKAAQLLGMNPTHAEAEQIIADCNPTREYLLCMNPTNAEAEQIIADCNPTRE